MAVDHIRYDLLAQQALRGVVRTVLADVAKKGLPGEHHFKITFGTAAPGVRLSDRMRAQYPDAMTIILQHQFWDLTVGDDAFEVGLSFGGVPERLAIPFDAITAFYDPSVQFGFQFEVLEQQQSEDADMPKGADKAQASTGRLARDTAKKTAKEAAKEPAGPAALPAPPATDETPPHPPASGGAEVVRLDRFRKR